MVQTSIDFNKSGTEIKFGSFEIVVHHFEEDNEEARELTKFLNEALKKRL